MNSSQLWLGNQIKGFMITNLPSLSNFPNNPASKSSVSAMAEKPDKNTNYIVVSSAYSVEDAVSTNPFTVKTLYME